ncbi:MAG: hypothetical protein WA952_05070 [Lewinella sp.]
MEVPQSELFKRMPREVKRAALRAAIAGQRPGTGLDDTFQFEGKRYRVVPVSAGESDAEQTTDGDATFH